MSRLMRHARGVAIAMTVLALSATAVLGAGGLMPTAADHGLQTAAEAAGKTVPVDPDAPETEAPETDAPETDAPETDAPETEAPDAEETEASEEDGTHGDLVSEAAGMETPDGFENHGAFVSCVAKLNHGQWGGGEPEEPVVLAELTPERCEELAEEAAAAKAEAKAERDAARAEAKAAREAARAEREAARDAARAERAAKRAAGKGGRGG